ncbi:MAG: hypothetical protein IH790_08800 [Acidobacteria bacterium]|nr:hypothetical protein [Acidobacteriota bacterium]
MKRRTARPMTVILLLTAAFLSSGLAAAQDFGGRAGGFLVPPQRVLEHLGITDPGQLEQINQLREDAKTSLGALQEEQKGYRQQLRSLLELEAPDPTDVGNAVLSARNTGEDIRTSRQSFREQFQLILTPEQLTALEEFNSNRRSRRGFRRGFRGGWGGSHENF